MSRHVSDDRLGVIHIHLSRAIRQKEGPQWLEINGVTVCDGHDLICLLDELRRRRSTTGHVGKFQLGHTAQILISMKEGDEVEIEPTTQGALTAARRTARKHLENPHAIWRSYLLESGRQKIVRAPDGSPVNEPRHNPAVHVMAKMRVGETVVLETLKGKMHNGIKVVARRISKNPQANWRCTNLSNGKIKCVRIR